MTSPSPTLPLARRLGALLGLSEGLDGPTMLQMSPGDLEPFFAVFRDLRILGDDQHPRFNYEMRALYLPSLVRTLLYNPIEAFEAIEPAFYEHYLTFVSMQIKSAAGYRLIREHPTEATEFRAKVLDHIINWSGEIKPGVGRDWTVDAMSALVHLYDQITFVALATRDNSPQGRSDPLYVTPRMRDELSVRVPALHELGTRVRDQDRESYPLSLDMIRATLLPDLYSLRRGDVLVAELVENGRYDYWWACEVKQPAGRKLEPVAQCDEGTSDELRACGRCLAVRYCSERHQKLHWKQHKLTCIAPTW